MKNLKNKKGISLIVLVITIIVMIILAAAIILALNGNNVVSRANQAKASSDLATFQEEFTVKKADSMLLNNGKTDAEIMMEVADELGMTDEFKNQDGDYMYIGKDEKTKAWTIDILGVNRLVFEEAYEEKKAEYEAAQDEMTDAEIMMEAARELGIEDEFKNQDGKLIYTGKSNGVKAMVVEIVSASDIVEAGYLIGVVDGETFITGLDSAEKHTAGKLMNLGYIVKNTSNTAIGATDYMTTGYTVHKGEELIGTIVFFGDTDGSIELTSNDATVVQTIQSGNLTKANMNLALYLAASVLHNDYIYTFDAIEIQEMIVGNASKYEAQNAKVKDFRVIRDDAYEKISIDEVEQNIISSVGTRSRNNITLSGEYTYKHIYDKVEEVISTTYGIKEYTLEIRSGAVDGEVISKTSTEKAAIGDYIIVRIKAQFVGDKALSQGLNGSYGIQGITAE